MDDRDFLGYFTLLGSAKLTNVKQASSNIVDTLLTLESKIGRKASMDSAQMEVEEKLKKKFSTGDLGEKMSADLNYTLKRLVRGLCSDNHSVKQGFFLASVLTLNRFKDQIDLERYMKFIKDETKLNSSLKNPEIHALMMGRMMCVAAIIESGWTASISVKQL